MKTIGIIGGIGPESTIDYYRRLLTAYGQRRPGEAAPAIIINSIDVRKLLALAAGQHDRLTEYLLDEIARLHRAGAQIGLLAANTPKEFVLQFDVGTCMEAGADPVAWIKANPGRIKSVHLKDWAPGKAEDQKGYRVLFGEGVTPWKDILAAAESVGGVEYYLMEQEGSRFPEFETAARCLATWKTLRGAS